MASINPYLNFNGNTEEAFNFYKSVFGGEFLALMRFKDNPDCGQMSESDKERIMQVLGSVFRLVYRQIRRSGDGEPRQEPAEIVASLVAQQVCRKPRGAIWSLPEGEIRTGMSVKVNRKEQTRWD